MRGFIRAISMWALAALVAAAAVSAAVDADAQRRKRGRAPGAAAAKQSKPPAIALEEIRVFGEGPAPFALDARAAMLVDAKTGEVLYAYHENERMLPASLAKIMTFLLALDALKAERVRKDTQVTISEAAWRLSMDQTVSRMFLPVGARVTFEELLYGLMVSSGNDAAVALAEYLAGSSEAFTKVMNERAQALGLENTNFTNPDGLPTENQYTTAADMVRLGLVLLRSHPESIRYTEAKEYTFHDIKQRNFNTLLFYDDRVTGIKTGHVREAGFHLVVSARSGETELLGAVMGTPNMERRRLETKKLLDWAFRTFATAHPDWKKAAPKSIAVYGGVADEAAIAPEREPYATVMRGQEAKVAVSFAPSAQYLVAPVAKGTRVGELRVTVDGKPYGSIAMVAQEQVAEGGLFKRMRDRVRRLW
jgi:D-alanyl-D-alanine carboxypeptidase (penicillin-binding protein 5/6)